MTGGVLHAWAVPAGGGLSKMVAVSTVGHAVVLALVVLLADGLEYRALEEERTVMTISLGGAPGPRSGGMTPMGGRPVQEVSPPAPAPEPVAAPAPRPPQMVLPTKESKPARPAPAVPKTPEPRAVPAERGKEPIKGPAVQAGSAVAETGGRGIAFGLSTGGGGGTGGEIDIGNFCCPDYLTTMLDLIRRNWSSRQQVAGVATVRFTVQRDGTVTDVAVARSSGYAVLDLAAQRAIASTRMPPLPSAYPNRQLTVHLNFEYER